MPYRGKVLKCDSAETSQIGCINKLEDYPEQSSGPCAHVNWEAISLQSQNLAVSLKNEGKVLRDDPAESEETNFKNQFQHSPKLAHRVHVESSVLSHHLQKTALCCKVSNISNCDGVIDQTAPICGLDTADWSGKARKYNKQETSLAVDQDLLQCQNTRMLNAKESLGPYELKENDGRSMFNLPSSLNCALNVVDDKQFMHTIGRTFSVFSFIGSRASLDPSSGKQPHDIKEYETEGRFVLSKRRTSREFLMSSRSQKICSAKLGNIANKLQCCSHMNRKSSLRKPKCHFTTRDIERLVTAVEKLGTGRWRDIKETYFSVERHRSAANLKDKWRSLLHSAKLAPAKQRSVKLASMLVKRILDINEQDKLANLRNSTSGIVKIS